MIARVAGVDAQAASLSMNCHQHITQQSYAVLANPPQSSTLPQRSATSSTSIGARPRRDELEHEYAI